MNIRHLQILSDRTSHIKVAMWLLLLALSLSLITDVASVRAQCGTSIPGTFDNWIADVNVFDDVGAYAASSGGRAIVSDDITVSGQYLQIHWRFASFGILPRTMTITVSNPSTTIQVEVMGEQAIVTYMFPEAFVDAQISIADGSGLSFGFYSVVIDPCPAATPTPTPTETPIPTVTPTPTPDWRIYATVAPDEESGIGQPVAFAYEMNVGDVIMSGLLAGVLLTQLVLVFVVLWRRA